MGEVYLAEDTQLDRKVAIKFLPADSSADERAKNRLLREARAAARLDHPNICSIHEVSEENNRNFIVMQYVEGETLARRLQRKPLDWREALGVAIQVADALSEAHLRGVIHRDIKPSNVVITARGQAKVMDFGLAKVISDATQVNSDAITEAFLTEHGTVVGTVPYMSPEQVQGETVDARSDVFSFGAVLYEIVGGQKAFTGKSAAATFSAILSIEPPPLARYAPDVPAELERIAGKCLEKNRERRYQTMRDVLTDLENLQKNQSPKTSERDNETATTRVRPASTDRRERFPRRLTSRFAMVSYGVALLLVIGVAVYALKFRGSSVTTASEIKSLAVIPLDNLSGDPGQDYLADGMTEALITELSKIGSLRVISRTSVMQYKSARKPLPEIGRELNVDAIVAGSVQRSGDKIGITAQLIRAATDQHLWADQYERPLQDVFSLQREVARAVAAEIKVKLTPRELQLLVDAPAVNPEALNAYLKGRDYFNQGKNAPGISEASKLFKSSVSYFQQAIDIDPKYAMAYSGLSLVLQWAPDSTFPNRFPESKQAAIKALQLDETLAEAHGALGYVLHVFDRDWAGAEKEFRRALELNPNDSEARYGYGIYLSSLGRHDEAIREMNLAEEMDPLTLPLRINVGNTYRNARQYDLAIEQYRRLLDIAPNNPSLHYGLGMTYIHKRMYSEGIVELRKAVGQSASWNPRLAWGYAASGNKSEATKILNECLKRLAEGEPVPGGGDSAIAIAAVYVALGDKDQAIAWLEKDYQKRSSFLFVLKTDERFDPLHDDSRFKDLLRRIGFPQ